MLKQGSAKKVSVYVSEDQQYHGQSVYAAILDYLFYRGVSGATVIRGMAGFGADRHLHTTRILRLTEDLPVKIEFIEASDKIEQLIPKLTEMAGSGLIEIQDTAIVKPAMESKQPVTQPTEQHFRLEGRAKMMRIYIGESDRWRDKPLHEALVEALRANDIAGVTVYRGIMGYGANRRLHRDSRLHLSRDCPIMLSVVDSEDKLRAVYAVLDEMIDQGLVVLSDVDIIKYTHRLESGAEAKG